MSSFDSLGLSAALQRGVAEQGYTTPTPIQARVIPVVLEGRDVLAGAQTGTGKTAGFTLPLLHRLAAAAVPQGPRRVRALILTPTRELAAQVEDSVRRYGKHVPLRSAAIFGGVSINPQIALLRRGVDVLVATPGRLLDHASQKTVALRSVEIFVLDEADRMLDMGFLPDIKRVLALLPQKRQNLLFSATFPDDIRNLAHRLLASPVQIEVAPPNATADRIEQVVHLAEKSEKRALLSWLIGQGDWRQVLVFTRTKHGANRLAQQLEQDGFGAAAIHGNKSQGARTRALADFKAGSVRVLVATDIAARGIDIDQLPHVVNYELPEVPEHYVHRIGRTGRAGREGIAASLVSNDERPLLKAIERLLGQRIPVGATDGFDRNAARAAHARNDAQARDGGRGRDARHRAFGDARRNRDAQPRTAHDGPQSRDSQRRVPRDAGRVDHVHNQRRAEQRRDAVSTSGERLYGNGQQQRREQPGGGASRHGAQPRAHGHRGAHAHPQGREPHGRPRSSSRAARRRARAGSPRD